MASINIGGVNIYYETLGQGAPLVMVQGFGHHSLHWGELPAEFAKQYRVIMIDNRGTGRSDKPDAPMTIPQMADDIIRILDELSIPRANVFGISMGGRIAQRLAINHPERVLNLILGCTFAGGTHQVLPPADGLKVLFDIEYMRSLSPKRRTWEVFSFMCSEEYIARHPEAYKHYHDVTMKYLTPGYIFKRQAEAMAKEDTWEELAGINIPTMFITGTADRMVPFQNSELMQKRVPGSELVLLQDNRHSFFIEAMDSTRIFINGFIKRHTPK